MKKASIITIVDNQNFGTYLQAFALCVVIEKLGFEAELIDYTRPSQTFLYLLKHRVLNTAIFLKWPKRLYELLIQIRIRHKDKKFVKCFLSKISYSSYSQLKSNPPIADFYITGSDQVWNSWYNCGIDRSFYLDFGDCNIPRFSYASSIGMSSIPENERAEMSSLLSRYRSISLREQSSISMLQEIGVPITKMELVLDPTLLIDRSQWCKYSFKKRLVEEPYVLLYSVEKQQQNDVISQIALKISKKRNLKVVAVYTQGCESKFKCADYDFFNVQPQHFLNLMYYAEFCVVSSFHGTAFSVNFNKDFITVAPEKFNGRVMNLLNLCGLQSRLVTSFNSSIIDAPTIDYTKINSILEQHRLSSINFLLKSISI